MDEPAYRESAYQRFSEPVRTWFSQTFAEPTDIQLKAWDAIAQQRNTLVIAPTGSGKTLAAFLFAIDRLLMQKADALESGTRWPKGVRVLYVSPLKALGADVDRNLQEPLSAISQLIAQGDVAHGRRQPEVRTAMRTGDTTPEQRRKILSNPPDILITTPESLYLMLTSQARETLRTVETVIVDEVHAIAGNKRGAHLSLSLERLDDLLESPVQRIGLSATVRPADEVARFLGGIHPVQVVSSESLPRMALTVSVPVRDMTAIPAQADTRGSVMSPSGKGGPARRASAQNAWKSDRALKAYLEKEPGSSSHPDSRIGSSSIWPHIESAILDQVLSHRSTIVFVNSRGLAEKLTARLNELYARRMGLDAFVPAAAEYGANPTGVPAGESMPGFGMRPSLGSPSAMVRPSSALVAKAHHGSVSKEKRLIVERELKAGEIPCVVATSSLELGIDMGSVDLVIQVAAPPSVASGLQRIGRASHQVGGQSQGIVFPRTRTEVIDATVAVESMRAGAIESTRLVSNPLDVLAQQTVAAVSSAIDGISATDWLSTVRRSACFSDLGERSYEHVLDMLAGRYGSGDIAEFSPRILWDRQTDMLKPRPQSQRLAVTAAGTIPDRGLFSVVLPEGDARRGRRRVGELDEEMVFESRVGDVIALGTSTWRIKEIGADRVIVEPAPGRTARLPFWHGESVGRPVDLGRARGSFLRAAEGALSPGDDVEGVEGSARGFQPSFDERLKQDGLDPHARRNLADLLLQQQDATGAVPNDRLLAVEQCRDEMGDWRVMLHSPFGRRVHEPWALAVASRVSAMYGFDPQINATDDGILLRIPMTESKIPGKELFLFDADELDAIVRNRVGSTALFAARFRECAARALLMTPTTPGKRAPLWQQRLKAGQLLEAARQEPDFPIVLEALRECLQDVFDLSALHEVMVGLDTGAVRMVEAQTTVPSPFAGSLIFGYVGEHLYAGDLPHAERQASMLSVDPDLLGELLGAGSIEEGLDPSVIEEVGQELQRLAPGYQVRGKEGVSDLLRELGPLSTDEIAARSSLEAPFVEALQELQAEHRIFSAIIAGQECWVAADDGPRLHEVIGMAIPSWAQWDHLPRAQDVPLDQPDPRWADEAGSTLLKGEHSKSSERGSYAAKPDGRSRDLLSGLVTRFARTHTPFSTEDCATSLGLGTAVVRESLEHLASDGKIMKLGADRWVDRGVLRRLRSRSLSKARAAIRPVSTAAYMRFLFDRQEIAEAGQPSRLRGIDGVAEVIAQFEGIGLPAAQWESEVFPTRVPDYRPAMLDELIASGEVLWMGMMQEGSGSGNLHEGTRLGPGFSHAGLSIALFPTDSPLAPMSLGIDDDSRDLLGSSLALAHPDDGDAAEVTVDHGSLGEAVVQVLSARGPLLFRQLCEGVSALVDSDLISDHDVAEALQALVCSGRVTNDSFAFPRAGGLASSTAATRSGGQAPPPSRRRVQSRRGRSLYSSAKAQARSAVVARQEASVSFDVALSGRWCLLVPADADDTLRAIGFTESVLDRYGVITRDIALLAGIPGGMNSLMPVLRALESNGDLVHGMFVDGLGPSQYASRDAVEALRSYEADMDAPNAHGKAPHEQNIVVLPVDDPACLFGLGIPWPASQGHADEATRPTRRDGAVIVLMQGEPVIWAAPRLKSLITFTDDLLVIEAAMQALVDYQVASLKREGSGSARKKILVERVNGISPLDGPWAEMFERIGLIRLPDGFRLYINPF